MVATNYTTTCWSGHLYNYQVLGVDTGCIITVARCLEWTSGCIITVARCWSGQVVV